MKSKKLKTKSQLMSLADKLFSIFIRERDNYVCFTCGRQGDKSNTDCGHYHSRSCYDLRYNEINNHAQCKRCNIFLEGNKPIYAIRLMEKYGKDVLFELDEIYKNSKKNIKKYNRSFFENIIKIYS